MHSEPRTLKEAPREESDVVRAERKPLSAVAAAPCRVTQGVNILAALLITLAEEKVSRQTHIEPRILEGGVTR